MNQPFIAMALILGLVTARGSAPLTPAQELATFEFADKNLTAVLVASEPNVISPVAMAWDASGALFVAEMSDYPVGPGPGKIKRLTDRNGDGFYETATIFEDTIPFPNGVLPYRNGLLVTAAPNIWFLVDTDGDGQADFKQVVMTGFAEGNQQLRVNGLQWGMDGWIYGANGRSDGEVRFVDPLGGSPTPNVFSLRGKDFRFRPEGQFEPLAGRSQFGVAVDEWGNRFLSWNTQPVRHDVMPESFLNREPALPFSQGVFDVLEPGDDGKIFGRSDRPRSFNSESSDYFNALAGLTIYRGDGLGPAYRGSAFVGETLRNLVHRRDLIPQGVTFVARRGKGEATQEFLASSDSWFHPVNFAQGPDGMLYLADFYRQFVEHPQFVPEALRQAADWRTGFAHGRIWRITPRVSQRDFVKPGRFPSRMSAAELAAALESSNPWLRETAQRLIFEKDLKSVDFRLIRTSLKHSDPAIRLLAFRTLALLKRLDSSTWQEALRDPDPRVRAAMVRAAEGSMPSGGLAETMRLGLARMAADPDVRVRYALALIAGEFSEALREEILNQLANGEVSDPWMRQAILGSAGKVAGNLLTRWAKVREDNSRSLTPSEADFIHGLGVLTAAHRGAVASVKDPRIGLFYEAGRLDAEARSGQKPVLSKEAVPVAEGLALDATQAEGLRVKAIIPLAYSPWVDGSRKLELFSSTQPPPIQLAAVERLLLQNPAKAIEQLFQQWETRSLQVKRLTLNLSSQNAVGADLLLNALEQGIVKPVEVDPVVRKQLALQGPQVQSRMASLFQPQNSDRVEVLNKFRPVLTRAGNREKGAILFTQSCLSCHAIQSEGGRVGPDLSGIGARPLEALLTDILDPNREVAPDFVAYQVVAGTDEPLSGIVVSESAVSITLRRPNVVDLTLPKSQVKGISAEGKSLMPEGLEEALGEQGLADLIAFLKQPDRALLTPSR